MKKHSGFLAMLIFLLAAGLIAAVDGISQGEAKIILIGCLIVYVIFSERLAKRRPKIEWELKWFRKKGNSEEKPFLNTPKKNLESGEDKN